jgi:hypothetical protein
MAAEDELALPTVPEARPEDPEDVSWALSTAEAMWARGDNLEGIKWVRKAAEAAADAEQDERYLELVKAASDLASLIARRSMASIDDGSGLAGGAPQKHSTLVMNPQQAGAQLASPQPTSAQPVSAPPASVAPATSRSGTPSVPVPSRPPPMAPVPPKSAPPAPVPGRSVAPAPIPLPSRASAPPRAPVTPQRAAPRPLATSDARQGPQAGRGILSNRTAPEASSGKSPKARRRSRENLDLEAKAAGVLETAPHAAVDVDAAARALRRQDIGEVTAVGVDPRNIGGGAPAYGAAASATTAENRRARRKSRPEPDPTVIGSIDELVAAERGERDREKSAEEWDASPTENLGGDELADRMSEDGDRKTTAFAAPLIIPLATASVAPPAPSRGPQPTVHDPEIQTSQAVRVVVWRDGNGVHIAPAGTVVSSITIDAVLVVLEPTADLTAWLSQRER